MQANNVYQLTGICITIFSIIFVIVVIIDIDLLITIQEMFASTNDLVTIRKPYGGIMGIYRGAPKVQTDTTTLSPQNNCPKVFS